MNSLERVGALLTGQPYDRRPFTILLGVYGAALTGCPLRDYFNDPAAYVRGQSAVRELFQPDILFGPPVVAAIAEAWGARVGYGDQTAPVVVAPAVERADEWTRLVAPDLGLHPRLHYLREGLRRMVAEAAGQAPVAAVLLAPIDLASLVLGIDAWMGMVLFDRAAAQGVLERMTPFCIDLANECFADGAAFAVWPTAFASPQFVTRKILIEISRPSLAATLAGLKGPVVMHHLDGPLGPFLDQMADLPGMAGFALAQEDDLAKARATVGPGMVLLGGPAAASLRSSTRAQVEAVCQRILEDRRADPRFILSTSRADVLYDTPAENIQVLRDAVEQFGRVVA